MSDTKNVNQKVDVKILLLASLFLCSCGTFEPWELRLAAEDWEILDGRNIRLHYAKDDLVLNDIVNAEAYLDYCENWHDYLADLFTPPGNKVFLYKFRDLGHWKEVLKPSSASSGAIRPFNASGRHPQLFLSNYESAGHELVHIMTYRESQPAPALLFEGLAVTYSGRPEQELPFGLTIDVPAGTDGQFEGGPVHECGAKYAGRGRRPHAFPSYWSMIGYGTAFYCIAGSFTKYLIDTYGLDVYMQAFRMAGRSQLLGNTIEIALYHTYGKTMDDIEEEWLDYLYANHMEYF